MSGTRRAVLVVALLLTALVISPAAAAGGGIEVTLTAPDTTISARSGVWIDVTYTNTSASAATIVKWQTPVDGLEAPLFDVALAGQPVAYIGKLVKRAPPTPADYLTIPPGDSLTFEVNLADSYSFRGTGKYTVGFSTPGKSAKTLVSNDVTLQVAGRPDAVPYLVAPTYSGCTAGQQTGLATALASANTYATGARSYFTANRSGPRYLEWFGAMDAGRYATVKGHYDKMASALATATVSFDCSTCTDSAYAYVYANQPYKIYICGSFWSAPNTGTDSRAGTLIHELSHFTVLGGTEDYAYGQSLARSIAITIPSRAVMNADNHEYFAENTPVVKDGPVLSLSATSHDFGLTTVNSTSPARSFRITNTGDTALVTGTLSTTGQFAVSTACNAKTLLPAGACDFTVTFSPTSSGVKAGSVSVPGNVLTAGSISLSGTGAAPGLAVTPSSHDFGEQRISITSPASSFRISNTGNSVVTLGTVSVTTGFAVGTQCNAKVLAVGAHCDLTATFTPSGSGLKTGSISIPSTVSGSPHTIALTGSGVLPAVTVNASSHDFGEVEVGTTSTAQSFLITNSGTGSLQIATISVAGPFSVDDACDGAAIPAGASCSFTARFAPTAVGVATGTVSIPSNGAATPHTVSLSGVAPAATARVSLSLRVHDFGSVAVGTTSAATAISVTSTGTAPVSISSITAPAGFLVEESTCRTATVLPQQSCTFNVAFRPVTQGGHSGQVTVNSSAIDSPATATVTGFARPGATSQVDPLTTSVSAKAVSGRDKILVRVLPARGATTQWTFHIQKRAANRWATLPKARSTQGAAHTARVNLPKGKYRVMVDAVPGYLASVSKPVRLTR